MRTIPIFNRRAGFAAGFILAAFSALAASDTWNGGSLASGNWSDKTNWNGSTVASSGDLLFFAGTTRLGNTNDLSAYSFGGVIFNSGAGLFNLNGNTFDLTGGITNNSTSGQTINNNITFSAGNHVIYTPASTASITNNGNLGEDGSGPVTLTYSTPGSKTLVLNGSNSITGGFTFTGTSTTQFGLVLGNTNALGTNWVNINNGALNLFAVAPGANPFVIANPVFTNSRDAYFNGSNVLFTGVYVEGGAGKALSVASGQTVTFNNGIYNLAASYSYKGGPGTLVLNGALAGAQGTLAENGVNYSTSFYIRNLSGGGTVVLGNPGAVGSSSQYFVIDAGASAIMANTDLSGANAITANVVLSAANGGNGVTIGGTNNIAFGNYLYVSIGTAGAVTRYLIVTNTAVTTFSGGSAFLSDGSSPGTLSIGVANTSGGLFISDSISDGNMPGGSLIITSNGMVVLSGANSYTGNTTITGGQLWVNAQGASQSSTFVVNANGGLVFSNDTTFVLGSLAGTGNISLLNNLGSPVSLTIGNNNASTVYSGAMSGAGAALTKVGSGISTLSGTNSYTGLTTVSQGTLVISPHFVGQGDVIVNDGTTLGVSGNTATTSAQIGTLQFGSSGSGTTTLQFSSLPAPTTSPITVNTLNANNGAGSISVSVGAALNVGTYNLVSYTNLAGAGFSGFAAPSLTSGNMGYLINNTSVSPNVIQLVITSSSLELWTGAVNTNWDFSTFNWQFSGVSTNYFDNGPVLFDDTASQPNVNLATTVQPFSILVTNNTKNYTLTSASGSYISGATTLTKVGAGSLTMQNLNNTFTGDVLLGGGTVALSSSTLGGGNVTLNSGALVLSASLLGNAGNVTLNGGSLVLAGGTTITNNSITDNASIVSSNGSQSVTGNIIGSGTLTQNGNGALTLSGVGNAFNGGTTIQGGTITASAVTGLGTGTVTLGDGVSASSATLTFVASGTVANNLVVEAGGIGTYNIIANDTFSGSVTVNSGLTISNSVFLAGPISGAGTITIGGGGGCRITSTGNSGFTGGILISNNSTFKAVNGALNTNNPVAVDVGSTYDTLAQPSTIAGLNNGPNGGGYCVPSGSLLTLGGSGSYSFSGDITNTGSLLENGSGTQVLAAENDYTGTTTVSNGTLVVNGSLAGGAVTVAGGTLAGTGVLNGPTTVFGGTLSPAGNGTIGTLTISNSLSLQGTLAVDINKTAGTNDLITGLTSVTYGGTLAVSNMSGTLTATDSFQLFSAGSYSGAFASITPAVPAAGLAWNTNTLTTDGTLRVTTAGPSGPGTITNSISGNTLNLTWPAGQGWRLVSQTNTLSAGLNPSTNAWFTVPGGVDGSISITINPANPTVFYQLISP